VHQGNRPQQHNQQANQQRNNQQNHQGQKPNNNQSNQNKLQNPVQQPQQPKPQPKRYDEVPTDRNIELIEAKGETLKGLTVLGKIELPVEQPRSSNNKNKKKRKRIKPAEKVTEAEIRNEKVHLVLRKTNQQTWRW
jgi:translation initiation factor IF-2